MIFRIYILFIFLCLISFSSTAYNGSKKTIEAESGKAIGGATIIADKLASKGMLASFTNQGQAFTYSALPAGSTLAIRYATLQTGTISLSFNEKTPIKLNIHSSGAFMGSYLYSIITVKIPAAARLTIRLDSSDVALNIDQIIIGNGDLDLPPDIWNLPPLPVAAGPYQADWKEICRMYTVPEWWRDAKLGAWSHWDPQSMPEQGDWYARGMYIEGNPQYKYHLENFGSLAKYGYKDIAHNWVIDQWNPEALMDLYAAMGARYFMAMGVHHDNFDCWDSKYQPWNSVNVGPKVDIVGTWEKVARKQGLHFGIGFQ